MIARHVSAQIIAYAAAKHSSYRSGHELLDGLRHGLRHLEHRKMAVGRQLLYVKPWIGGGKRVLRLKVSRVIRLCIEVQDRHGRIEGCQRLKRVPLTGIGCGNLTPGPRPHVEAVRAHALPDKAHQFRKRNPFCPKSEERLAGLLEALG